MQAQTRALVNPQADFWLLGGLSLIAVFIVGAMINWDGGTMGQRVAVLAYYLALIINYPHFAYSYQIFYTGLPERLRSPDTTLPSKIRIVIAGFVVPAALIAFFLFALLRNNMFIMGVGVSIMTLLGGWHYARQGYGALITNSIYRGIFYSPRQKFILNLNAYVIPAYAWIRVNMRGGGSYFYDIPYGAAGISPRVVNFFMVITIITSLLSLAVFLRLWLIDRRGIPINGVTGYVCSSYIWVLMTGYNPLILYLAPCFHSLQYLPFIYKFKKGEAGAAAASGAEGVCHHRKTAISLLVFAITGAVLGFFFMDALPKIMDHMMIRYWTPPASFSRFFFLASFLMFVSYHHYFIDYAFWRRDNRDVQKFVFRA
jgi:hypothetical protein